jgi:hypothetical protein
MLPGQVVRACSDHDLQGILPAFESLIVIVLFSRTVYLNMALYVALLGATAQSESLV